jgi:hypothetical protein
MPATVRLLKIFTDRAFLPEGFTHSMMLKPHWGDWVSHDGFAVYTAEGAEFQELTGPDEADVALLPFDGCYLLSGDPAVASRAREAAGRFAGVAADAGLPVVLVTNDDSVAPVGIDGAINLRTSIDRRRRTPGDYALPGWFEDLVTNRLGGSIVVRDRPDVPTVGFCGLASSRGPGPRRRLKMIARGALRSVGMHLPLNDGVFLRKRAMDAIEAHPGLRTNFIVRDQFFGGTNLDAAAGERVRREYVDNLVDCDYALSARGYGNYSFRFYEALSIGRIPVLIDTDCVLPFDFLHDYREFCVIVPEGDVDRVGDHILRFHDRLSPGAFRELQARIRRFWMEWLSPYMYFRHFPSHLEHATAGPAGLARG